MKNLHSHTEFCDGRADMSRMAAAAYAAGFQTWGTSPHSPICCESCANMKMTDVEAYIRRSNLLKKEYAGKMEILTGMEIDYVSPDFGPQMDYFRNLPLDYRIGSVHFVRTRDGRPVDCDGPAERFLKYLESEYAGDLRYVAETYFAMELEMIEAGGFDILGHLDKIGDNGSVADPNLENYDWYADLVEKVIAKATEKNLTIEINTKKYPASGRFFPSVKWWPLLKKYNARVVLSTDAHYPDRVAAGYKDAERLLADYGIMLEKEYGLIGKVIGHSYSANFFNEKFHKEGIPAKYSLFPLDSITLLPKLLEKHPALVGLNVTIPYKVEVMQYLDALSEEAEAIGAVNVIKITEKDGRKYLTGYNSDAYGFTESLKKILADNQLLNTENTLLKTPGSRALVLGTGGASRAVVWSLRKLGFTPQLVGRQHKENCISYGELTPQRVYNAKVVVNCTPLGTSPDVNKAAPFPYQYLHEGQICFDLVYNPAETLFMRLCKAHGCIVSNGLEMLRLQAVGAWRIWEGL